MAEEKPTPENHASQGKPKRTRVCPTCKRSFSYEIAQGRDRKHCSKKCRVDHKLALRAISYVALPLCKIEKCENKATRVGAGLCETHYYRYIRNGHFDVKPPKYRYISRFGYIKLHSPGHPLADSTGTVFEHRFVMYQIHGQLVPPCFWCGVELDWKTAVIDHLNEMKADNRLENLVPSCNNCNRARGAMVPLLDRMTIKGRKKLIKLIKNWDCKDSM